MVANPETGTSITGVTTDLEGNFIVKTEAEDFYLEISFIGFETTTPMTAALLEQVLKQGVNNLYFHINHVLVPPAVDAIMSDGQAKINAFIGPAHVSVISGAKIYQQLPEKYATPVVVSGFEPIDVLQSILMIVRQKNEGRCEMEIQYSRSVTLEGNIKAQRMIEKFMEPREHFRWRGSQWHRRGPTVNAKPTFNPLQGVRHENPVAIPAYRTDNFPPAAPLQCCSRH